MPPTAAAATPSTPTSTASPGSKKSTAPSASPPGFYAGANHLVSFASRAQHRRNDEHPARPDFEKPRREGVPRGTPAIPDATNAFPARHRPSAAVHRSSYTTFPPNSLEQSSPHLPSLRIAVDIAGGYGPISLEDPFHDRPLSATAPHTAREREPEPEPELPRDKGHSRSTSTSGLSDSLRNLNRWSASTASSRASNFSSFTRRVSAEALAGAFSSPGRRLHRSRLSTSTTGSPRYEPSPRVRSGSPPPALVPPLQTLPRISIGPSLEDEVRDTNVLGGLSPTPRLIHARRPSNDPGLYWDGTPERLDEELGFLLTDNADLANPAMSQAAAAAAVTGTRMPHVQSREPRGHSRSRSSGTNGIAESASRNRDRDRTGRPPSQRAMLSRALQKANTAVQLDNAGNVEGARMAYSEACGLLEQVLQKTSAEEDRNKLEAIVSPNRDP